MRLHQAQGLCCILHALLHQHSLVDGPLTPAQVYDPTLVRTLHGHLWRKWGHYTPQCCTPPLFTRVSCRCLSWVVYGRVLVVTRGLARFIRGFPCTVLVTDEEALQIRMSGGLMPLVHPTKAILTLQFFGPDPQLVWGKGWEALEGEHTGIVQAGTSKPLFVGVAGGWRLVVDGPLGRSLRAVPNKKKAISLKTPLPGGAYFLGYTHDAPL